MFLVPGDSPMGYRLPLDSLLWEVPEKVDTLLELDPFAPRGAVAQRQRSRDSQLRTFAYGNRKPAGRTSQVGQTALQRQPSAMPADGGRKKPFDSVVRTALCVEPRHGRLYVFMPPQRYLEDYLDLVAAVEDDRGRACTCRC